MVSPINCTRSRSGYNEQRRGGTGVVTSMFYSAALFVVEPVETNSGHAPPIKPRYRRRYWHKCNGSAAGPESKHSTNHERRRQLRCTISRAVP